MTVNNVYYVLTIFFYFELAFSNFTKPTGFKFGVSTASYQIEGGWNANGKGENIWDRFTHTTKKVKDHSTGDIACDSYHLWEKDVELLEDLGVDFYRFSLSWSRILPTGFSNKINKDGVDYYNKLINSLKSKDIEPMVTIYHWDLPQPIQDLGGWTNYATADFFAEYARVVFSLFGDKVKLWITINEPASICMDTYEQNINAPDIKSPGIGSYLCGKSILLAHAKAYRIYQKEFKDTQNGKVGISISSRWAEPKNNNQSNVEAAEREMQMTLGGYANPIFSKTGDYPAIMSSRILNISLKQNFTQSRLPAFSPDEVELIKGTADFLGLNHYRTMSISAKDYPLSDISFTADKGTYMEVDPNWKDPEIIPWGFSKLLQWIKDQYNNPLVYVTENGIGDKTGTLDDSHRVQYIEQYVKALFSAVNTYGCNVARYSVWSLMDNMEWSDGYTIKYGLYHVDFKIPTRPRTRRSSASFYKGLIMRSVIEPRDQTSNI